MTQQTEGPFAFFAVDRIVRDGPERMAVLIPDNGEPIHVPHAELPSGTSEGAVLRVARRHGQWDWSHSVLDQQEQTARLNRARQLQRELRRRDPGGDLRL